MLGSIPIASSARTPPIPSSMYWARRVSSSPMYRRLVIQRAAWEFSGRSASSRNSGTRPMSTRQIWATTFHASIVDRDRLLAAEVTSAAGRRSGSVSTQYSCCHRGCRSLAEVARR